MLPGLDQGKGCLGPSPMVPVLAVMGLGGPLSRSPSCTGETWFSPSVTSSPPTSSPSAG